MMRIWAAALALALSGCAIGESNYACRDTYEVPPVLNEDDGRCTAGDARACGREQNRRPRPSRECRVSHPL